MPVAFSLLKSTISIHALRVEGDCKTARILGYFGLFLSTPSGWRATALYIEFAETIDKFLSTPSGWRATLCVVVALQ